MSTTSNTGRPVPVRVSPQPSQLRVTMNWVSSLVGWPAAKSASVHAPASAGVIPQGLQVSTEAASGASRPGALVFNDVERQIQKRVNIPDESIRRYEKFIRTAMPEQHQKFFSTRSVIYVSIQRPGCHPIAAMVAGMAGFISAPSATQLKFDLSRAAVCGASASDFTVGTEIGILGLEHETRRRNRANGRISASTTDAIAVPAAQVAGGFFTLEVDQSFGNCPKYIQKRTIAFDEARAPQIPLPELAGADVAEGQLTEPMRRLVAAADTFFIASTAGVAAGGAASTQGTDMSHRGGGRGFVEVAGGGAHLRWPDFKGNDFFMTLGNIAASGSVSLLFVDYESGALLRADGTARIDWDVQDLPGAQRTVVFDVGVATLWGPGSVPITHSAVAEWSPHNPQL